MVKSRTIGFFEGIECTKDVILFSLHKAIDDGNIIISKGEKELFRIIENIGKIEKDK